MFVDASAIVALITLESDADSLAKRLERSSSPITSGIALFEAIVSIVRIKRSTIQQARKYVDEFLSITGIGVVEISQIDAYAAVEAFTRFGKGRHPAGLNMGDCFAYACAKIRGVPLLCKGDDFIHTDIEIA